MGVVSGALAALGLSLAVFVPGCYDPELRDCTVQCAGAGDCAGDQVCGTDGYCSAPAIAGSCGGEVVIEGTPDARPPIDAAGATLRIVIAGKGRVTLEAPEFACESRGAMICLVTVPASASLVLAATANPNRRFEGWTTANCSSQGATCTVLASTGTTLVKARFTGADDLDDDRDD